MKKIQIVDASIAIKWFVNEKRRENSLKILDQIQEEPSHFAVPELFFAEMLSVLSRLLKSSEQVKEYMHSLQDLGLERIGMGRELLDQAAFYSTKYQIAGYDAIYLASAALTDGEWMTCDEKAHHKLASLKLSRLIA